MAGIRNATQSNESITWWLWNGDFDGMGHRVIVEVKTVVAGDDFRVDTPIGYFTEYDGRGALTTDRMMIDNEEFAELRAAGAIRPLSVDEANSRWTR